MLRTLKSTVIILLMLVGVTSLASCGGGSNAPGTNESATAPSTPAPSPKSVLENDVDYVRKGQYTYVWFFARKDGKPLDGDDSAFLRKNAPQVVDWVTTDKEKKYVIAGTNFDLALGGLELIKKRFIAEDYSNK
jgi:hypothetical protein